MQPLTSGGGGSGSNTNVLASPLHTFESSNRQTLPNESSDKYQENQTGAISGSNDDSRKTKSDFKENNNTTTKNEEISGTTKN